MKKIFWENILFPGTPMQTSKKLQYTYIFEFSRWNTVVYIDWMCISKIGRKLSISKMVIILLSAIRSI